MLTELKRGDRVVTGGGILGTVTRPPKPEDREIEVELAPNLRVTVVRETINSVIKPVAGQRREEGLTRGPPARRRGRHARGCGRDAARA